MSSNDDSGNSDPDYFIGAIDSNPELAAALGLFLANFAALEIILSQILAEALGSQEAAQSITGYIQSVAIKAKISREIVAGSAIEDERKKAALAIVQGIQERNALRNEYVHGLWEGAVGGEVRLAPYALSRERSKKQREVSAAEVSKAAADIRKFVSDSIRALFPADIQWVEPKS